MHAYYFIFNQQNSKINGNINKLERRRRSISVQSNLLNSSLKRQRNLLILTIWWYFLLHCASYPIRRGTISEMGSKMKGIYKGFKYSLSQIFVVKEREIEIGYPTDVKHVAHIGWDGPSGSAPSWMNQFKSGPDFAATSIGNSGSALSPWSSQDYGGSDMFKETPLTEHAPMKKKQRRKKKPLTSSPKSNSGSSSKSSRAAKVKAKAKFVDGNANPTQIEVA